MHQRPTPWPPHFSSRQYHRFLCDIGDTDNARALFDRAFSEPDNLRSALLWQRYVQFEYELGNVAAAWQVRAG